jgi:tight adherence protein B
MLRLKVKSLSAEGRLSGVFLSVMPFLIFGIVSLMSPEYYGGVRNHPAIIPSLIIALVLLAVGNFTIYRMVHFKV